MNLKHLFLENKDPKAIVGILSSLSWQIHIKTPTWGTYGETTNIHQLIDSFPITQQNPILVSNLIMLAYVSIDSGEKFQTLKNMYHPELDKPVPPPLEGFHDEDEFKSNDGPECLGYEFIMTGQPDNSIECEGMADVFDTRDVVELPPEVKFWMQEHFKKWLKILNRQLANG